MTYYLMMKGSGEGCDYTIGCNQRYERLLSEDFNLAIRDAVEILDGLGAFDADPECVPVEAVIVQHVYDINIDAERYERANKAAEIAERDANASERAEYERLKAKFDKE